MAKTEECVQVIVRCRPLNQKETEQCHEQCVRLLTQEGVVEIRHPKIGPTDPPKTFTFDAVYDCNSKQADIYEESFANLVDCVLNGFNGTIFAYGQTGTGKTFTMEGIRGDADLRGVIPRSFEHIFTHISASSDEQYLVRASYLEIYQEEIRDLLSKDQSQRLELKERPDTGIYVKDLSSFVCKGQSEIEHVMNVGNQNRKVGPTNMNEHSSRSHAIFIITVECSKPNEKTGKPNIRAGKLNLVDLAGSERQAKTGATGERLKEATKINLSLSALGNVISALVDGKSTHVPYRDSKLTRLLQDSLGGNAKTVMVANIGPAGYNYEESLTTLRYSNRAKNIKNKPRVNEDPKDALLREFQDEIARLKAKLGNKSERDGSGGKRRKRHKSKKSEPDDTMETSSLSGGSSISSPEPPVLGEDLDLQQKLVDERDLLETDTSLLTTEKERLMCELKAKEAALSKERQEQEQMKAKIRAMESKLLTGTGVGGNMVEHTNEQKKILEKRRVDIAERRRAEREAAQLLEEREEQGMELEKTYTSLQQEVDMKTKKLKKLFAKLQSTKQDILDVTDEYNRDRRDLEDTQKELLKELKLKYLMIENFIPPTDKSKILSRAQYDDDEDGWFLSTPGQTAANTIAKRPVSAAGSRRPMSEYARLASSNLNSMNGSRFRGENVMRLSLDHSGRTTRDYEGPAVAPRVQAALDAAMQNIEPDIDIDVMALSSNSHVKGMRHALKKGHNSAAQSSRRSEIKENQPLYPSSRGLVPK
ncbi:hypothetical protein TCAL_08038 [Tigriopus californicus]|uniref:Kinesin-like protein n=1 Tax=Tigriopus californicus TaxID=6832 RepID=A0A553NNC1_TIGCA|nr:kinesin-like protein KIF3B [Tigriopus californicus]TRY66924.1 hypothetical protein TCAL_08038 [Tigriopus californicus]|eukprot:TCALIF_08038-PA protein Name:"Similar to KIF3B Kinesin-like protein KIF3B (Homo sapiens)" AED:0.01 eAED:0.01 QI:0/-1/0/1/-1/1/1/0/761